MLINSETMKEISIFTPQTMTSLEIAELTGKQHKNVMQAIRTMEPAWTKTCGLKFQLTSRTIVQPNGGTREVTWTLSGLRFLNSKLGYPNF